MTVRLLSINVFMKHPSFSLRFCLCLIEANSKCAHNSPSQDGKFMYVIKVHSVLYGFLCVFNDKISNISILYSKLRSFW